MSQNRTGSDFPSTSQSGTGQGGNAGTPSESSTGLGSGSGTGLGSSTGAGTAAAPKFAQTAQEYGEKLTGAASQAKDYVSDKMTVVGDKIKELQNADLGEMAENAKDYARKNPGQAILISAAAGLLVGLVLRGRRS